MRRLLKWGIALVALISALVWLWPPSDEALPEAGTAADDATSGERSDEARLRFERKASSWALPVEARGALSLTGRVLTVEGTPAVGAVVTATAAHGEDVLSDLDCKCDNQCGRKLLECGCPEASTQMVDLVATRTGEAPPLSRATTDGEGRFELRGLPEGAVALWADGASGIAFLASSPPDARDVELRLEAGRTLEGVVKAGDDSPVPGALVTAIYSVHSRFFDATSDADGKFEVGPLPSKGAVSLVGMRDGLLPDSEQVRESDEARETTLLLHAPRQLSGTVLAGGLPRPDVEVALEGEHRKKRARTDAEGRFRFGGLRPGSYDLRASEGSAVASAKVKVERLEDREQVRLELEAGAAIFGRVMDDQGAAIPEARIGLSGPLPAGPRIITDRDGHFRSGVLPPGKYEVEAWAEGYIASEEQRVQLGSSDLSLTLQLRRGVELSGVVVDPAGQPIDGAQLRVRAKPEEEGYRRGAYGDARSADGGVFRISGLLPGAFTLTARADGWLPLERQVAAPSAGLRLELGEGATVSGVVTEADGRPIAGARLSERPAEEPDEDGLYAFGVHGPSGASISSGPDGRFELKGVPAGERKVVAFVPTEGQPERAYAGRRRTVKVTVPERGRVEARLVFPPTVELGGTVVDASGKPVADARVWAQPVSGAGSDDLTAWVREANGAGSGAATDAAGRFVIRSLDGAQFKVQAHKPGYARLDKPLEARANEAALRIVLAALPEVVGRVVDEQGAPLPEFRIDLKPQKSADGRFRVHAQPKERTTLLFEAEGYAQRAVDVPRFEGRHDLGDVRLSRGRVVEGVVRDLVTGKPVVAALVDVTDKDADALPSRLHLSEREGAVRTDSSGRFRIDRVDPAMTHLAVTHEEHLPAVVPLAPAARDVEVGLDPGASLELRLSTADGKPLSGSGYLSGGEHWFSVDVRAGRGVVSGLPAGAYVLRVDTRGNRHFRDAKVQLGPRERKLLELEEATGGTTLTVSWQGGEPKGVVVVLLSGAPGPLPSSSALAAGEREMKMPRKNAFEHLLPGSYTLLLIREGERDGVQDVHQLPVTVTDQPSQSYPLSLPTTWQRWASDDGP